MRFVLAFGTSFLPLLSILCLASCVAGTLMVCGILSLVCYACSFEEDVLLGESNFTHLLCIGNGRYALPKPQATQPNTHTHIHTHTHSPPPPPTFSLATSSKQRYFE